MNLLHIITFVIAIIIKFSESAKILAIFPTPSISHQVVFRALTQDLAKRGHELLIFTPDPVFENHPNVTEIDLSPSYKYFKSQFNFGEFKAIRHDAIGFVRKSGPIMETLMEEQLSYPEVKKFIKNYQNYHFDLMIMESTAMPMLIFAKLFDCPVISILSMETPNIMYQMLGNEANIMVHPEQFLPYGTGTMTFEQRWHNLKTLFLMVIGFILPPTPLQRMESVLTKHFPGMKIDIFELMDKVDFLMVNAHPAMGFVRPLVPNTIQLGFMHIEPPKPLKDGELKSFMDNSQNGVIYISFGTNVASKDLDREFIDTILKVINRSKYDFVWKFDAEFPENKPKNLFLSKWLPQADLLAHPKVKIFITQSGQQSAEEAVDREIPMIVIPFCCDQNGIAKKVEQKGIAFYIDLDTITDVKLENAIEEMTKPFYKKNIKEVRKVVHDQPMTSREKAVWWTEYVIRNKGSKHLDYAGRYVPFYQKYALDFIAIAIVLVIVLKKIVTFLIKSIFSKKEKVE